MSDFACFNQRGDWGRSWQKKQNVYNFMCIYIYTDIHMYVYTYFAGFLHLQVDRMLELSHFVRRSDYTRKYDMFFSAREVISVEGEKISTWNSKQPVLSGCFTWMTPNHYMKNGWKSPCPSIQNGLFRVPGTDTIVSWQSKGTPPMPRNSRPY